MYWTERNLLIGIFLTTTLCFVNCENDTGKEKTLNEAGRLLRHLLNESHYESTVPPERPSGKPFRLDFGLNLNYLYGLDEEKQTIDMQMTLKMVWNDSRLTWNPTDYRNMTMIRIPIDKLWRPDFAVMTGAYEPDESKGGFGHQYKALTMVQVSGLVAWWPPIRVKSYCQLDMSNFPFDKQNCFLVFGPWAHDSKDYDPQFLGDMKKFDLSFYLPNHNWDVRSTRAFRSNFSDPCCPNPFAHLIYNLELERRRSYYSYMLVLPGATMALLLPVMFLLPVGRPEKFNLGCSVLICLTLLTILMEMMVPTAHSSVPFIEAYYLANFIVTGVSLAISAVILNLSRCRSEPPAFLRKIVGVCAKCCCINMPSYTYRNYKIQMNTRSDENPIAMEDDGTTVTHNSTDWFVIATIMDRFFMACSMIVAVLMAIGMASQS